MTTVVDNLEKLNRKERFFLIGMALGNPGFRLDSRFRQRLSEGFNVVIPDTAFVAMDYHLNWIYAAAALAFGTPVSGSVYENANRAIDGTQEDVDLLVAFEDASGLNHLIMLEAKGVTAFTNRQFQHKMNRLISIFGETGDRWPQIKPHFGLVSPRKPKGLHYGFCPAWLKIDDQIPWFRMTLPSDRVMVLGCDGEGRPDSARTFWTTRSA